MSKKNYLTIAIAIIVTITPQLITVVPSPYRDLATAVLAAFSAYYHLYETPPTVANPTK